MEGASGAEAAGSAEQIELELEGSAANDDQPSSCAADDNPHDQEEGKCWSGSGDRYFKFTGFVLFRVSVVEVDDEKPPAYDSLNGAAEQDLELPSVQQKRNTFIGEFVELVIENWLAGMHIIFSIFKQIPVLPWDHVGYPTPRQ